MQIFIFVVVLSVSSVEFFVVSVFSRAMSSTLYIWVASETWQWDVQWIMERQRPVTSEELWIFPCDCVNKVSVMSLARSQDAGHVTTYDVMTILTPTDNNRRERSWLFFNL